MSSEGLKGCKKKKKKTISFFNCLTGMEIQNRDENYIIMWEVNFALEIIFTLFIFRASKRHTCCFICNSLLRIHSPLFDFSPLLFIMSIPLLCFWSFDTTLIYPHRRTTHFIALHCTKTVKWILNWSKWEEKACVKHIENKKSSYP